MADKSWKAMERRVAQFFGTLRNSLSGMNSKVSASDTLHPKLFIECKQRASFAHHTTYDQAKESAKKEGKIPVLCTHEKGAKEFLVTLSSKDLPDLLKILEDRDSSETSKNSSAHSRAMERLQKLSRSRNS
jgi:hypothetical protein